MINRMEKSSFCDIHSTRTLHLDEIEYQLWIIIGIHLHTLIFQHIARSKIANFDNAHRYRYVKV